MKSAYELAMERLEKESGKSRALSDEEKARIAEVDRKYDAQAAETRLSYESKIAAAPYAERPGLADELRAELGRIEGRREQAKNDVWESGGD